MDNDVVKAEVVPIADLAESIAESIAELLLRVPREFAKIPVVERDKGSPGDVDVGGMPDGVDVGAVTVQVEQIIRRASALAGVHAAAIAQREIAKGKSPGAAAVAVADELNIERGEARARVERGERSTTAEGRALAAGHITERQERAFAGVRASADGYLDVEELAEFMDRMVEQCGCKSASGITRRGNKLLAIESPEWAADREARLHRERSATVSPQPDGSVRLTVQLDAKAHAVVAAILARYARPGRLVGLFDDAGRLVYDGESEFSPHRHEGEARGAPHPFAREAERLDERSAAQRNFDALLFMLVRGLRAEHSGRGGVGSIVVRVTPDDLDHPERLVESDAGAQLSVEDAVRMAQGRPWFLSWLAEGQENLARIDFETPALHRRSASALQRMAIYAAHGGCTCPGCEVPAAQCDAHHLVEWQSGGLTELRNLTFACSAHHADVGDGAGKWCTTPVDGHPGLAKWSRRRVHRHEDMASGSV